MKKQITAALAAIVVFSAQSATAGTPLERIESHQFKKKEKAKPYPLTTCVVSDDKLGEMGKPVVFIHEGQEIKLCCKECRADFDKDPAKYLKKLSKK